MRVNHTAIQDIVSLDQRNSLHSKIKQVNNQNGSQRTQKPQNCKQIDPTKHASGQNSWRAPTSLLWMRPQLYAGSRPEGGFTRTRTPEICEFAKWEDLHDFAHNLKTQGPKCFGCQITL